MFVLQWTKFMSVLQWIYFMFVLRQWTNFMLICAYCSGLTFMLILQWTDFNVNATVDGLYVHTTKD